MKALPSISFTEALGPAEIYNNILPHWRSPHQWQLINQHTIGFVRQDACLFLNFAAMSSVVEYYTTHIHRGGHAQLEDMLRQITPEPKPEPEVQAALERDEPDLVSYEPEEPTRFIIKIRLRDNDGDYGRPKKYRVPSLDYIGDIIPRGQEAKVKIRPLF